MSFRQRVKGTLKDYHPSRISYSNYAASAAGALSGIGIASQLSPYKKWLSSVKSENKNPVNSKIAMAKKNYKRKYRKRKIIKKRIPRALASANKLIKVKVSDYDPFTMTSGALAHNAIQGNSIDDPFIGGGDGQPLGYDQWKALYKSAYVLGCKVKLTCHNSSSTVPIIYGITPMKIPQSTSSLNSYEYYQELPGTVSRLLSPDVDHGILVSKRSTKKFLKRKDITDNEDLKLDLVTETPPTDIYYFHVWAQPVDQTTTGTCDMIKEVEYIVLLTDPVVPSRSVES